MTRLDTAALHHWLTEAITAAENGRNSWLADANRISQIAPTVAENNYQAALDAADQAAALFDIDGWLRTQAGDQLHQPGHDLNPTALLASGQVEADVDELRTWIMARAAATPIETRAKTYTAVAAELDRFALDAPFPSPVRAPRWEAPVPRRWPHRLVMVYRAARDLVR